MEANVGSLDKTLRLLVGALLFAASVYFKSIWPGLFGVILVGTALASRCPLYLPFHLSTRPKA